LLVLLLTVDPSSQSFYFKCNVDSALKADCVEAKFTGKPEIEFDLKPKNSSLNNIKAVSIAYRPNERLNLTRFPIELFAALQNLRDIYILSYSFDTIAFDDTMANLESLCTINNDLKTFKSTLMFQNARLINIDLYYNSITTIEKDTFNNMIGLQLVSLRTNRITSIHPEAFRHMNDLKKLVLNNNPLRSLHVELFQSLQPNLYELILAATEMIELPKGAFKNFDNLTLLDLQRNKLSTFDTRELELSYCKTLKLAENQIKSVSLNGVKGLVELNLSSNSLDYFNATEKGLMSCNVLILNKNHLTEFDLKNVEKLDEIDLESNELTTISSEMFPAGSKLTKYSFKHNRITSIDKKFFDHLENPNSFAFLNNPCVKEDKANGQKISSLKQCFENFSRNLIAA
jgi:Leucine-rich repeat (LRR) protein